MATTNAFKEAAYSQETSDVFLVLLTIDHDDIDPAIRVVNNNEAVTSNGNLFSPFPFDISLPDARVGAAPLARLTIDNVSREIAEGLRAITTPATIQIEIIRAAAPDTIELTWSLFLLKNVRWDMFTVSGDLITEELGIEPFPIAQFSPANFAGLFQI